MTIERNDLSVDAVKINGSYIEDDVTGYKTIKAVGRETLEREINTVDLLRDGLGFKSARFPSREIEVTFLVQRDSLANMRESMTQLMQVLNVSDAEVIFNEEPDFFFMGTPSMGTNITEVKNGLLGSFIIQCLDPFKYSVEEKEETAENGVITVDYNGTYKGYPTLIAEFANTEDADGNSTSTNECGFVGFVNQREKILQFGDPEEKDWEDVTHPATVPVNKTFKSTTGTTDAPWDLNNSQVLSGTQVGNITTNTSKKYMYPSGYGSGSGYHGPSLSCIPQNEVSPIGKNFTFTWKQKFTATKSQFGGVEIILWNNNNGTRTMVGAVKILKTTKDTKCKVYLYCGSSTAAKNYTVACSKIGACSMEKSENKITFNVGGKNKSCTSDTITDLIANEVTFHFMRNGTKTAIGSNFVYNCKLQRFSFPNKEDVENTFMPGDVLTVNTQDAGVYLDEGSATISAANLGALGNDWEEFYLVPGQNTIACDYSDFTTVSPTFTLKYRERFL